MHLQTKIPKLTQSWVLMATKISGSFGSPQAFRAHGWLSSLGPEACDRCYLLWHGFGLPNPRTFLWLSWAAWFFFMGEKTHLPNTTGKIEGESNRWTRPIWENVRLSFLWRLFFFGGKSWGFIFGNPFRSDFAMHLQKSPGKISLNNKETFTKCRVLLQTRGFGVPWMRVANAGHKLGVPVEVYQLGWLPVNEWPAVGLRT